MRIALLLLLVSCSKKPVDCKTMSAEAGSTTDIFTFEKGTTTVELRDCSDETKRTIWCRSATSGGYKCECTTTEKDGTYRILELRTQEALTKENAKDFARKQCEWKIQ